MKVTYENSTDQITLGQAIWMHERLGICTIIHDGKDITFEIEEPIRKKFIKKSLIQSMDKGK